MDAVNNSSVTTKVLEVMEKYMGYYEGVNPKAKFDMDVILDEYNDYMRLYKMFEDQEYKNKADKALQTLKVLTD